MQKGEQFKCERLVERLDVASNWFSGHGVISAFGLLNIIRIYDDAIRRKNIATVAKAPSCVAIKFCVVMHGTQYSRC